MAVPCSQSVHGTATDRCDDSRGFIVQFCPPDDEHMCSKRVEAWNKLIIKFSASIWLILIIKILCEVGITDHGYEKRLIWTKYFKPEENKLKFASNLQALFPAIMKNCRRKCRWRSEWIYWVLSLRFGFLSYSKSSCRHFFTWCASKRLPWDEIFLSVWTFFHHASTDD